MLTRLALDRLARSSGRHLLERVSHFGGCGERSVADRMSTTATGVSSLFGHECILSFFNSGLKIVAFGLRRPLVRFPRFGLPSRQKISHPRPFPVGV
jgi:hypothetical protein